MYHDPYSMSGEESSSLIRICWPNRRGPPLQSQHTGSLPNSVARRDRTIAPVRHSPERVSRASEAPCVVHECRAARQLQHWVRRPLTRQPSPETKPAAELGRSAAARHPPEPRLSDAPWGKGHPKSPRRGGRPTARDLPPCKHSRKGDRRVLMTTCADHAGGGRTSCSPARP